MNPTLRRVAARGRHLTLMGLAAISIAMAGSAHAQETWPARTITVVSPFDAGSQPDLLARAFAEGLREVLGRPAIVQNRVGGSGTIAVESVSRAPADGYTLGFGPTGQFTIQPRLRKNFPYAAQDFEFLCQTNTTVFVLIAGPKTPYSNLADVIEAARRAPATINYGSAGHATFPHLITEWIAAQSGVRFNHVPFKAVGDMIVQLANGSIEFMMSTPASAAARADFKPLLQIGDQRAPRLDSVPLARDTGYPVPSLGSAVGVYAPKGLPPQVARTLREACARIVEFPAMKATSETTGTPILYRDGPAYTEIIARESREVGPLLERLGTDAR